MTYSLTIEIPEIVFQSLSEETMRQGKSAEDVAAEFLEMLATRAQI